MANCSQCGSAVTDGTTFCPVCGAPQTVGEVPGAAATEGPPEAGSGLGDMGFGAGAPGGPATGFGTGATGGPVYGAGAGAGSGMPAYRANLANLTLFDRVGAVATLLLFISLFLPWYHVSGCVFSVCETVSASATAHGYMYIVVILCIVILLAYAAKLGWGKLPFALPFQDAQLILVLSAINLLLVLIAFFFGKDGTSWSFGAFFGLIFAIVAMAPTLGPVIQKQMGSRTR